MSTFHYSMLFVSTNSFLFAAGASFFNDNRLRSSRGIGTGGFDLLRLNSPLVSYPWFDVDL